MSIDPVDAIDIGGTVVIVGILLVGIYRAVGLHRAFVTGVYRSRATWSTLLMLVIIWVMLNNFVPTPNSGILSLFGFLPFVALLIVFGAYADRSVLVAIETDFFHRDPLRWTRGRWLAGIVLVVYTVTIVIGGEVLTSAEQSSFLGNILDNLYFFVVAGVLAYAAAAMIVGARRSADRTLRRSILLLALALSTLVVSIVVTSLLTSGTVPYEVVDKGTGVVGIYLIYRSVMSLSPLGRIEKEVEGTPHENVDASVAPSRS